MKNICERRLLQFFCWTLVSSSCFSVLEMPPCKISDKSEETFRWIWYLIRSQVCRVCIVILHRCFCQVFRKFYKETTMAAQDRFGKSVRESLTLFFERSVRCVISDQKIGEKEISRSLSLFRRDFVWGFYWNFFSASIFSIKVINVNTKIMSEICSKFTIKKPEWRHWCHSGVYIVNFEQISHITVDFEQVTLSYIMLKKWLKIHTAIGHFSTLCMKELLPAGFNPFKNHALSFWIIVYQ